MAGKIKEIKIGLEESKMAIDNIELLISNAYEKLRLAKDEVS